MSNVTELNAGLPKHISDQVLKTNDAYDVASANSRAMMEFQKQQNDLVKAAQETSKALMEEHKKLSNMIAEWRGKPSESP